ncbi:hypothetical protein H6G17_04085 [Chroococcidiopsis sp. FACHB-1243]|nr:hypothetical protein [Chroococcidiopsis sp. [FACHB-1243]]MBD2304696.1 hypothetical protein [Chroococcidiopsis sp. [FACHB-1243]]
MEEPAEAAQSELDRVTVATQTAKVDAERAQELLEAGSAGASSSSTTAI